jgi:hypothetical protein
MVGATIDSDRAIASHRPRFFRRAEIGVTPSGSPQDGARVFAGSMPRPPLSPHIAREAARKSAKNLLY